jgi:RloB-like protein
MQRDKPWRLRNSFELGDQVWTVFDRDQHQFFEESIELCTRVGVNLGRSNRCLEVWLILDVEDFHRPDDRRQVCRHLYSITPRMIPAVRKPAIGPGCSKVSRRRNGAPQINWRNGSVRAIHSAPRQRPSANSLQPFARLQKHRGRNSFSRPVAPF